MELYNLKHPDEVVSFSEAIKQGLGKNRGLFFPKTIPVLDNINGLLELNFTQRSVKILNAWLGDELGEDKVKTLVENAFNFDSPLVSVSPNLYSFELFHGPTLAFKDFGARFMAQCLSALSGDAKITILTATSGDTGAAVADAFYGLENINVVVLYPKGRISLLQEKMFTTLGNNIHTIAINGDFDACQALVKQAFDDLDTRDGLHLNSANSINISRLLAQVSYYFEAVAQFKHFSDKDPVIAVPSGNFGNLTAGLLARAMGLPIKRFIAATNENDTVPRYLNRQLWQVNKTIATLSNAMDVSDPSNWARVEAIFKAMSWSLFELSGVSIKEQQMLETLQNLHRLGYLSEPHAAVGAAALVQNMTANEKGIFLATAHPAKFANVVEKALRQEIILPKALQKVAAKPVLSTELDDDFQKLKDHLFQKFT